MLAGSSAGGNKALGGQGRQNDVDVTAFLVYHFVFAHFVLDAFQRGDRMRIFTGVIAKLNDVGVGADHRHGFDLLFVQREKILCVFQQHNRLPRRLSGQFPVFLAVHHFHGNLAVRHHLRRIEQSQAELDGQQPRQGAIESFHAHQPVLDGFRHIGCVQAAAFQVQAGVDGHGHRFLGRGGKVMALIDVLQAVAV